MRRSCSSKGKGSHEVGLNDSAEAVHLLFLSWSRAGYSSVVDDDVEGTEYAKRFSDEPSAVLLGGHIANDVCAPELCGKAFELLAQTR
jgi:hypothetical protein